MFIKLRESTNITENSLNIDNNDIQQTITREPENQNEIFTWTNASTKLFLSLYKEKSELLTNKK